jgi:23S rRNA (adenine2030-N6)-methyltransferase
MFSYRHSFHAGNHADVLKHMVLVSILDYLVQKPTALSVIDTHAGAGLYRLDGRASHKSSESDDGIEKIWQQPKLLALPIVARYVKLLQSFNPSPTKLKQYPGSPLMIEHFLRPQDKLHAFEIHPTDQRLLRKLMGQRDHRKLVQLQFTDGFLGVKPLIPPPSRRGLLVCDPSYEIKTDYGKVLDLLNEHLLRFATGCALFWHPLVGRPEAHDLPRKLKNAATRAGRGWLYVSLSVRSGVSNARGVATGLSGSGVFVLNPPYVLGPALQAALPLLCKALAQDEHAHFELDISA